METYIEKKNTTNITDTLADLLEEHKINLIEILIYLWMYEKKMISKRFVQIIF